MKRGAKATPLGAMAACVVVVVSGCLTEDAEARAACDAYIVCAEHYAGVFTVDAPDTSDYEEGAPCFTDPDLADVCQSQCDDGRRAMLSALRLAQEEDEPCTEPN